MKNIFVFFFCLTTAGVSAQTPTDVLKIRNEAMLRSQVMEIAFRLTDVNGPRLTNSPGYARAADYAKKTLTGFGLINANLEPWGEFGKGWELKKSYVAMTAPYYKPLIAYPKTWTEGTKKERSAGVIVIDAKDSAGLQAYKGRLKNMVIMRQMNDTLKFSFRSDASRRDSASLAKMAEAKVAPAETRNRADRPVTTGRSVTELIKEMAKEEGAVAILSTSTRGHDGTLFVQGGGSYAAKDPANFLDIMLAFEDYMSLQRLAKAGADVKIDVDVRTAFNDKDLQGYNVIAEIPGSDPVLKNEWVMLGAHLDSWQGSTGATDNAAGCAVMMEAVRILKATGVPLKRSVRIALWSGEEQGLRGSGGYVKTHFGDRTTGIMTPDNQKVSAYYNLDNGTGRIRGIYTQNNTAVAPMFAEWLKPFHDLEAKTVTVSNTGGTDHLSFDRVGIPGFQFIQDELEYNTRTHHTNMDSYDHLSAPDLMQASAIVAAFVYNTANADAKLPRK